MSTPPGGPGGHGYAPYGGPGGGPAHHPAARGPYPAAPVPPPPSLHKPALGTRPEPEAKPKPDPGPGPRRSRTGLVAQFVLQFLYIPLWALIAIGLTVLAIWLDANSSANVGPPQVAFAFVRTGISWRRLRAEWGGRPEDWRPFTEPLLAERFAKAEKSSGWLPADLPPSGVRRATATLARSHSRGLGAAGVDELARRYGWAVDWDRFTSADEVPLFRLLPPPAHQGVPDPYGPPPAPGAPWGPLRCRVLMPLLTFVFLPRVRALELRRSADAYLAHLRTRLPALFAAELARDPAKGYRRDEYGRILRRVTVRTWHHRGAGAHAVLRVAAEHGWQLDHGYPADPRGELHLCRLDGGARQGG
ncbi:hypothetical protein ADL22_19820 [Streptomyces sp. NRRL F-4489]|uniref:hypothetical protein n=1 Tax=Streptomyces sp. NRRL F-4489 TaxID=1609095 RepID=UPI0007499F87|nr:hypothetical protein [Streptomyces sp. NRRL F-4489]KUL37889.1 hypothetical protein ADL22_19820 [Streptomyces sp. NRRL F-4489]